MESVKESLAAMTEFFHERMDEFQKEIQRTSPSAVTTTSLGSEFSTFKKFILTALSALQQQVEFLGRELDRLEMKGRRKILLLHGVPEVAAENSSLVVAEIVADRLKVTGVSTTTFSRCHRLGRLSDKKPRPLLVKFREVPMRDKVWFAKTKLKGTGVTLSEFLTKTRHGLFMEARQRFGVKQCWTRDGFIHVLAHDGSHHQVGSLADLDAVPRAPNTSSPAPAADTRNRNVDRNVVPRTKRTLKK